MQHCPIKLFRRRGVTLVEVLVSLSVIGLLWRFCYRQSNHRVKRLEK